MDLSLKNKVIIVSGGAKGIGRGVCQQLANEKAIPVIVGKDETDNLRALEEIQSQNRRAFQIVADLNEHKKCEEVIRAVVDRFGRIDGLVNNAGLNDGVGLENGRYEDFMRSLHRNLVHYYLLAHYALPYLKICAGSIVNITSKTAETGQGHTSGYAAANGGRNALTREWAVELLKYNIRVNAVAVAECWTPQYENWLSTTTDPEAKLLAITSRIPLQQRMTTTEEIANTVLFLLSVRSSHTTGQIIHVDGGYVHLDRGL
jgi:L-fucose dehydrogenase